AVHFGTSHYGYDAPNAKTDADGRFAVKHCRPGQIEPLLVTAKGFAPELRPMKADADVDDVDVTLRPSVGLRPRVTDPAGAPIQGVRVSVRSWRDAEQLLDWRAETDAEGLVV